jgi:hypothetical protein
MAAAALAPAVAPAQIFKCVDASGHTTYQQTPCPSSARGGRVELFLDNGTTRDSPENEAAWESAARERNVQVGMPPRYVRMARGAPRSSRPGKSEDGVSEVWSYNEADGRTLRVGFRNGVVAWTRFDDLTSDTGAPVPDDEATQRVLRRRSVLEGHSCGELSGTLGAPDRTSPVETPAPSLGSPPPEATVRYTWEPAPGDPYVRTIITCVGGRVAHVERINAR